MPWYYVTKTIGGRPYRYRQRSYREGGKVKTESQYVGPVTESAPVANETEEDFQFGNPFTQITQSKSKESGFQIEPVIGQSVFDAGKISTRALKGEYELVMRAVSALSLEKASFPKINITTGDGGYSLRGGKLSLSRNTTKSGSNRTTFKRDFRRALAAGFVSALASEKPGLLERVHSLFDHSCGATKLAVTMALLRSEEPNKALVIAYFLWSGTLSGKQANAMGLPVGRQKTTTVVSPWRHDLEDLIAETIQRGSQGVERRIEKDVKRTKANALRAMRDYQKLGFIEKRGKRGRAIRRRLKKWQTAYLISRQKQNRYQHIQFLIDGFK